MEFEQWYADLHSKSAISYDLLDLPTRYGLTRVAVGGNPSGEALVFLHGWSGNGMLWEVSGNLTALGSKYRIYLVDVIGQPNNSSPLSPAIKGKGYGRWLVELLDQLQVKRAAFIGMSFGGFLTIKLAGHAPDRLALAVLLGPAGLTQLHIRPKTIIAYGRAFLQPTLPNVEEFVRSNILGERDQFKEEEFARIARMFQISMQHFRPGAQLPYVFGKEELNRLKVPTLLLCGSRDALFQASQVHSRAQRNIPGLKQVHLLEGMGHALGNSPMVAGHIQSFLEEHYV